MSVREDTDDATGISTAKVIDWKQARPKAPICARDHASRRQGRGDLTLTNAGEAMTYFMSVDAILSVDNGAGRPGR